MKSVCIIGGSNIDMVAKTKSKLIYQDSNPGKVSYSYGGVGRNIAENLVRIGVNTTLITAIGKDHFGEGLLEHAQQIGLKLCVKEVISTPLYLAIMDENNDLSLAVSDMEPLDDLDIAFVSKQETLLNQCDIIVMDTNISQSLLDDIFDTFNASKIFVEAVSVKKVIKIKKHLSKIHTLKMNFREALALSGYPEDTPIETVLNYFFNQDIQYTYITRGDKGAYLMVEGKIFHANKSAQFISNTSGAGDAFFAGVIYAFLYQKPLLSYGVTMSLIALESQFSVNQYLNKQYLIKKVKEYFNE